VADDTAVAPERQDAAHGAELTRGQFLTKMSIGLGGLMGALIAVPVAGMALAPAVKPRTFTPVKIGDVSEFQGAGITDTWVRKTLNFDPESFDSYVQERVAYVRWNQKTKDTIGESVKHKGQSQGEYSVISNRCAHLGCPVTAAKGTNAGFQCPCHGGAYDDLGKRIAGPPPRSLDRFVWELRNGGKELWAVDEYSVSPGGTKQPLHGSGQHAGDLEGWLYPFQP
jgi:menaquinol-cytochrome c reductase iron-sulfur subunit